MLITHQLAFRLSDSSPLFAVRTYTGGRRERPEGLLRRYFYSISWAYSYHWIGVLPGLHAGPVDVPVAPVPVAPVPFAPVPVVPIAHTKFQFSALTLQGQHECHVPTGARPSVVLSPGLAFEELIGEI